MFSLDATDEFLEERVMNLAESVVQGTSHSVEKYFPRLATFRTNNSVDETVLKYFTELEIHPKHIGRRQKTWVELFLFLCSSCSGLQQVKALHSHPF